MNTTTNTNYDDILATNRARRAASLAKVADAATFADVLRTTGRRFGEDAVSEALVSILERNASTDKQVDPIAYARKNARGHRAHEIRTATRRAGREMKYANNYVPSDPTGQAAVRFGTDALLMVADGYAVPAVGKRGATMDYTSMAKDLGATVPAVRAAVVGAADNEYPYGTADKRARAAGMSGDEYRAAVARAADKRARRIY